MIPQPFSISVQWGNGIHHFSGGALTFQEAVKVAESIYKRVSKIRAKNNKGARPRVMIWELRQSFQDDTVGPLVWPVEK